MIMGHLCYKVLAADEQESTSCTYIFFAVKKKLVLALDFLTVEDPQIKNFCLAPERFRTLRIRIRGLFLQ
jgi:hypothetical protein